VQIEKIQNPNVGLYNPGLVDFFADNKMGTNESLYFRNMYPNMFEVFADDIQQRYTIGKQYGSNGVSLDMVCIQPSDTYYEICPRAFQMYPKQKIKYFLENYNVMIHDYPEGPFWYNMEINPMDYIKSLNITPRNVLLCTPCAEEIKIPELNIKSAYVPMFLLMMYAQIPHDIPFNFNPNKLALVPARKARDIRVKLLARLEENNLLKDCDWSLVVNFEGDGPIGEFFTSPSLSSKRFNLLENSDELYIINFFNKYKSELPKVFTQLQNKTVNDYNRSDLSWAGKYNYYISTETSLGNTGVFPTEKTWRGMLLGLPVLTLACKGFDKFLQGQGFKTIGDFDHLTNEDRVHGIIDHLQKPIDKDYNESVAKHNFDLVHNKDFILGLINIPE
jgi:hypothetical protein